MKELTKWLERNKRIEHVTVKKVSLTESIIETTDGEMVWHNDALFDSELEATVDWKKRLNARFSDLADEEDNIATEISEILEIEKNLDARIDSLRKTKCTILPFVR